jgi:hypothetical protein
VRVVATFAALLVAAVPAGAHAGIYKWVDEKGVVNYGSKPPEGARKVRQLDENAATVSTIPAPPRDDLALQRQRERALEARIERLERELLERRAREATPVVVVVPAAFASVPAGFGVFQPFGFAGARFVHPRFRSVHARSPHARVVVRR